MFEDRKPEIFVCATGEHAISCRGCKPWGAIKVVMSELGRASMLPMSLQQAEDARKRYGILAVGLTHSRGVAGIITGEGK